MLRRLLNRTTIGKVWWEEFAAQPIHISSPSFVFLYFVFLQGCFCCVLAEPIFYLLLFCIFVFSIFALLYFCICGQNHFPSPPLYPISLPSALVSLSSTFLQSYLFPFPPFSKNTCEVYKWKDGIHQVMLQVSPPVEKHHSWPGPTQSAPFHQLFTWNVKSGI